MRTLLVLVALGMPLVAHADNFPFVVKGPVITGVTGTDAWVAWETSHSEGTNGTCPAEASIPFVGNHNDDLPTLTMSPTGSDGTTFSDPECARQHRVHLTGLSANTHYRFTLDKPFENGSTAGGEFSTATLDPEARFDFVVYGDNRDAPLSTSHRADHQAVADGIVANESDAAFLVHTGDLALNIPAVSGDDRGYTEFFDVERGLLSVKPIYASIGNHETMDTSEFDALVNPGIFSGSAHPYFGSTDWGAAHIVILDAFEGPNTISGNDPGVTDEQAEWLDADLAAAQAKGQLIFAVSHQSPFSHPDPGEASGHGGSQPVQEKLLPILLKYRALAVFGGHDHYYQRGHEGCVDYFVVGGGGAPMYEPDKTAPGVAFAVKQTSYLVVSVDGHKATAMAKSASGSILDTFTFAPADGTACGTPPVDVGPGGGSDGGVSDAPDAGVSPPDAGTVTPRPDAGNPAVDAGTSEAPDAGAGNVPPTGHRPSASEEGCQCGFAGGSMLFLVGLLASRRRR